MSPRLTARYRVFATIALVAIGWLMPIAAEAAEKLQVLVNDTAAQIQLAYRQHPDERAQRQEQLAAAVAAWRAAPRNEANNERLANWLHAAILSSMPGSKDPLPSVPSFAAIVKVEPQPEPQPRPQAETHTAPVEPQPVEAAVEKKAPVEAASKPTDDPFRDDPDSASK